MLPGAHFPGIDPSPARPRTELIMAKASGNGQAVYRPHQGARERARRLRNMIRARKKLLDSGNDKADKGS